MRIISTVHLTAACEVWCGGIPNWSSLRRYTSRGGIKEIRSTKFSTTHAAKVQDRPPHDADDTWKHDVSTYLRELSIDPVGERPLLNLLMLHC